MNLNELFKIEYEVFTYSYILSSRIIYCSNKASYENSSIKSLKNILSHEKTQLFLTLNT